MASLRIYPLLTILLLIAVLVTYSTVLLPPLLTFINPGGTGFSDYGFPVPWKEEAVAYCSPLNPQACPTPIHTISYNWFAFAADVLFYTAVGFGLLLIYKKYRSRTTR